MIPLPVIAPVSHAVIDSLEPKSATPVRELLIEAGLDVSDWAYDRNKKLLANPNTNSHRNSFWSFDDNKGGLALCV
ncbi:hypothetical protein, partial [Collimonas silvisoli]|uniref:hypothetical protein n=1 Tax=Collimonas silvisoli TaxID=2825884 RepID=UPI001B8B40EC